MVLVSPPEPGGWLPNSHNKPSSHETRKTEEDSKIMENHFRVWRYKIWMANNNDRRKCLISQIEYFKVRRRPLGNYFNRLGVSNGKAHTA